MPESAGSRPMKWTSNLDLLVTIPATIALAILNIPYVSGLTGINLAAYTNSTILFALGAITISGLQDRKIRRALLQRVDISEVGVIQDSLTSNIAAEIEKSDRVMLIGISGLSYVKDYQSMFESKMIDGDELNVLVTDPTSGFVAIAASRDQKTDVDYQLARITETIKIASSLQAHGKARLKKTAAPIDGDYLVLFESGDISKIYYKHYGYKTRYDSSMWLHVDKSVPNCFAYFKQHVTNLWEYAL